MSQRARRGGRPAASALALLVAMAMAGCAERPGPQLIGTPAPAESGGAREATPEAAAPAPAPPAPEAVTAEALDTTSREDREAAAVPPVGADAATGEALGTTVASLGSPADPGFWAETPLVSAPRPGLLADPATGRSVRVELRPSGGAPGAGTRVSLPAMRVLEVPLTALRELRVTGL